MKNDKCNPNETFIGDKSFYDSESSDESNMDKDETIEFPGGTSANIQENIDQLLKSKPDCLIVHAR